MKDLSKTQKIIIIAVIILLLFVMFNVFWMCWRNIRYSHYTEGLEEFRKHYSYVLTADDGYLFNAKLPDYPTFTGNLCVATLDNKVALIIWPNVLSGYHYGTQIEMDGEVYCIELDENLCARQAYFDDMIKENEDTIQLLNEKAECMWKISKQ